MGTGGGWRLWPVAPGASAAAVATSLKGKPAESDGHLPGGDLFIDRAGDNHIYMTGPTVGFWKAYLIIKKGGGRCLSKAIRKKGGSYGERINRRNCDTF